MSKGAGGGGRPGRTGGGDTSMQSIQAIDNLDDLNAMKAKLQSERVSIVESMSGKTCKENAKLQSKLDALGPKSRELYVKEQSLKYGQDTRKREAEYNRLTADHKKQQDELRSKYTPAQLDAMNSRNLGASRQNDIMEGGNSFRNPSVYKSNTPRYKKMN